MIEHYIDEIHGILKKYHIDNKELEHELAEYVNEEQFQAWCNGLGD